MGEREDVKGGTRALSRPNRENAGNKLSRSFPRAVTDLWFIARLRRRILGEAKKRAHRCSFRDISQDRNEQSSRQGGGVAMWRCGYSILSTRRGTIVRRVNTFVDRENRRRDPSTHDRLFFFSETAIRKLRQAAARFTCCYAVSPHVAHSRYSVC